MRTCFRGSHHHGIRDLLAADTAGSDSSQMRNLIMVWRCLERKARTELLVASETPSPFCFLWPRPLSGMLQDDSPAVSPWNSECQSLQYGASRATQIQIQFTKRVAQELFLTGDLAWRSSSLQFLPYFGGRSIFIPAISTRARLSSVKGMYGSGVYFAQKALRMILGAGSTFSPPYAWIQNFRF